MNITIEDMDNRKKILQGELDELLSKANAISGAIQDCEYWISEIQRLEENKEVKEVVLP